MTTPRGRHEPRFASGEEPVSECAHCTIRNALLAAPEATAVTFFSASSVSFGLLLVLMTAMASWTFRTANAPLIAKLIIPASIFTLACATPNAMNSLLGFPVTVAFAALPDRAALVAFIAHDREHVVDLWLRQGDAAPRAYETALDENMKKTLHDAELRLARGERVMLAKRRGETGQSASRNGQSIADDGSYELDVSAFNLPPKEGYE
jgi:hypothetical protein